MYPRNLAATLLLRTLFGLTVFASTNLSAQMQDALPATTFAPALTKEPTQGNRMKAQTRPRS